MMKLLVVDDSHMLQERVKKTIMEIDSHLEIQQAYSYEEAVGYFSSYRVDTIILDIELPDGSGMDLLRKFRREDPEARMIIFTNYPTDEFKKRCLALGADYFIDKADFSGLTDVLSSG